MDRSTLVKVTMYVFNRSFSGYCIRVLHCNSSMNDSFLLSIQVVYVHKVTMNVQYCKLHYIK